MTVIEVFQIKGRGTAITAKLDSMPVPATGERLVRPRDCQVWEVAGVERFLGRPTRVGDEIGILLRSRAEPVAGDYFERFLR